MIQVIFARSNHANAFTVNGNHNYRQQATEGMKVQKWLRLRKVRSRYILLNIRHYAPSSLKTRFLALLKILVVKDRGEIHEPQRRLYEENAVNTICIARANLETKPSGPWNPHDGIAIRSCASGITTW
jgi:hypothetical protein